MLVLTAKDGDIVFLGDDSFVVAIRPPEGRLRLAAYSPVASVAWDVDGAVLVHHPDGPIRVSPIDPSKSRLGIEAPDSVRIEREALRERRLHPQWVTSPSRTE